VRRLNFVSQNLSLMPFLLFRMRITLLHIVIKNYARASQIVGHYIRPIEMCTLYFYFLLNGRAKSYLSPIKVVNLRVCMRSYKNIQVGEY
jgi:hypothetical protein